MAEKGFGVKEVNLIGASGTPTITSPNNLNLNAVNVAISTNASIGGTLTVTGNVSVGGTLTYEDVTNIDSVGIITARTGLKVLAGGANVVGVVTGTAFDGGIKVVAANSVAATVYPVFAGSGATQSGNLDLKTDNSLTYNSLSGELTAVKFTGDGSSLTGIAVTEAPVVDYTITANGSSAYRFHGGGVDETANNPDLYLIRGQKYRFNNTTGSSHPFAIREASNGSAYSNGVTGSQNGIQFFTVPYDAPASLFYQCTIHSGMVGNIYIRGAGGQNTNVGITTFSGMAFFRDDLTVSSSGLAVNIFESTDNHSRFRIKSGSSSLAQLEFADQDDADAGEIRYDHGNDRMTFHVGNNTERLRITSDGYLIKAAGRTCAFNVRGGNMSRTDTSGYICQFNDDSSTGCFDSGNNFNTSTYKFIAPVTGIYYFFTNIRLDQYGTGYIRTAFLSTNYGTGASYWNIPETGHVISYPTNSSGIMQVSTSTVVNLDENDELYVYQDPSADNSYTVYLSESSFGGYLIG